MAARKDDKPPHLSAEQARQGRIVLNTPLRRTIFFGGLIAFVLIAIFAGLLWP